MYTRAKAKAFAKMKTRDGFSIALITSELAKLYTSNLTGKPVGEQAVLTMVNEDHWPSKNGSAVRRSGATGKPRGHNTISNKKASKQDAIVKAIKIIRASEITSDDKETVTDLLMELI